MHLVASVRLSVCRFVSLSVCQLPVLREHNPKVWSKEESLPVQGVCMCVCNQHGCRRSAFNFLLECTALVDRTTWMSWEQTGGTWKSGNAGVNIDCMNVYGCIQSLFNKISVKGKH